MFHDAVLRQINGFTEIIVVPGTRQTRALMFTEMFVFIVFYYQNYNHAVSKFESVKVPCAYVFNYSEHVRILDACAQSRRYIWFKLTVPGLFILQMERIKLYILHNSEAIRLY